MIQGLLAKLTGGGFNLLDPKAAKVLLAQMGFKVDFGELEAGQVPMAFQSAAEAATLPDARVMRIKGTDPEGDRVEALLVLVPCRQVDGKNSQNSTCKNETPVIALG